MKSHESPAEEQHVPPPEESQSLTATRWTRYGKDRLYIATASGDRVGWLDLLTGESTIEMPEHAEAFQEALRGHESAAPTSDKAQPGPAPEIAAERQPDLYEPVLVEVAVPGWTDLALNRPGQGVRAEAESLLTDMKEKSKVGTFLKRALDVHTDERAFRVGADGEEAVGSRLDRLTKHGWHVLHSIPVGTKGSDLDHMLIGNGGVYVINTKRRPGGSVWVGSKAILVNGQKTDYLRNSRFEAERVRKVLHAHLGVEVPVRAVLVFLTGTVVPDVTIKQMPEDVLVLDRMDVPRAFKRAPERITAEMVERVYEIARRSTTWSSP